MNSLVCEWNNCQLCFTTERERFEHLKNNHITKDTSGCKWINCIFTSTSRWNMISHVYVHLRIVSETCYLCNRNFKRRSEFMSHYIEHSDIDKRLNEMAQFLLEKEDQK